MENRKILCGASEKAILVVNKCLDKNIPINTMKLEQLLIIIHGIMLSKYNTPFFKENVVAFQHALLIREVDADFRINAMNFKEKIEEFICLLDAEEQTVDEVITNYGKNDAFDLMAKKELKLLKEICRFEGIEGACNVVPNELIEKVFDYYKFYDVGIVKENETSFQKRLNLQYGDKIN